MPRAIRRSQTVLPSREAGFCDASACDKPLETMLAACGGNSCSKTKNTTSLKTRQVTLSQSRSTSELWKKLYRNICMSLSNGRNGNFTDNMAPARLPECH
ncbi:hypothetical protein KIN20_029746 [Parelaphostrongylus tenuis]|uniref:Uncharacterized protein n=1 Tax=Parelaphostrongylus tenuis TaxID=148309 RepID=A0AAD5WGC5_PARTN|nr:hypothetical protein KIN20_029746 [Parelaphostrongylus tenuis]